MPLPSKLSLYILSPEKFEEITAIYPEIAGEFYQQLVLLTINRLRESNVTLKVLREN